MDKIEGILTTLAQSGVSAPAADSAATASAPTATAAGIAGPSGPAFSDVAEPAVGSSLKLVDDRSLHVQQKARMDYGRNLATLLGMADVQLTAAESLPPPQVPLQS